MLKLGGALQVPDKALTDAQEQRQANELRGPGTQPYPHPFQEALARVRQPARRLRSATGDSATPIDHAAALRPLARADRAAADRRPTATPCRTNEQLGPRAQPRPALPRRGRLRHARHPGATRRSTWTPPGSRSATCSRPTAASGCAQVAQAASLDLAQPAPRARLVASSPERGARLMAPVQRRVVANGLTLHARVHATAPCRPALSAPLRRALRPRGPLAARAGLCDPARAGAPARARQPGEVSAAPPRVTPADLRHGRRGRRRARAHRACRRSWSDWLRRNPWLRVADRWRSRSSPLLCCSSPSASWRWPSRRSPAAVAIGAASRRGDAGGGGRTPRARDGSDAGVVEQLPAFPDFPIADRTGAAPGRHRAPPDSPRPARFKTALRDTYRLVARQRTAGAAAGAPPLDLGQLAGAPRSPRSIPRRPSRRAPWPASPSRPAWSQLERRGFVEPMAYPVIDMPMYEPLLEPLDGAVPAQHQPDRAEHHHAAGDQPALHRGLHGRPQPRVRARAAVARVPDRPARQLLPPVLGRRAAARPRPDSTAEAAAGEAARHPAAAPLVAASRSSATTTTARSPATTRRSWCSSSAASC